MQSWYRSHPYGVYPRGNARSETDTTERFGSLSSLVFARRADVERMQGHMRRRAARQRHSTNHTSEAHDGDTHADEGTLCVDAEQIEQPYLDIFLNILSFCEVPELCRLARSCTSWYVMVHATEALKTAYGALSPHYLSFDQNWKETVVKAYVAWAHTSATNDKGSVIREVDRQDKDCVSCSARLGTRRSRAEDTVVARVLGEGWSHCPVPVRRHYYSDILFHAWMCVILPTHYHLRRAPPRAQSTSSPAMPAGQTTDVAGSTDVLLCGSSIATEEGAGAAGAVSASCNMTGTRNVGDVCGTTPAAATSNAHAITTTEDKEDTFGKGSAASLLTSTVAASPRVQYTSAFHPVERLHQPTVEEFVTRYEQLNRPVILTGIATEWPLYHILQQRFTNLSDKKQSLFRPGADPDYAFRCEHTRMSLDSYMRYATHQCDERPIYLFDAEFAQVMPSEALYTVPPHFSRDDYFAVLGQNKRPKYRWLIAGPARGGSSFHVDPNYTNAWNANLTGRKRWLLFPPGRTPPGVLPSANMAEVATPVSLTEWLLNYYDASVAELGSVGYECVCEPGEIMFVPSGWWHYVINLEDSVAITQNYVSRSNLQQVIQFLRAMPHSISGIDEDNESVTAEQTLCRQRTFAMEFESAMTAAHPDVMRAVEEKLSAARCAREKSRVGHLTRLDASTDGFKFDF